MEVLYHGIKTRYAYDFPLCFPHELIMSLISMYIQRITKYRFRVGGERVILLLKHFTRRLRRRLLSENVHEFDCEKNVLNCLSAIVKTFLSAGFQVDIV